MIYSTFINSYKKEHFQAMDQKFFGHLNKGIVTEFHISEYCQGGELASPSFTEKPRVTAIADASLYLFTSPEFHSLGVRTKKIP